jgi:hypothetical protein
MQNAARLLLILSVLLAGCASTEGKTSGPRRGWRFMGEREFPDKVRGRKISFGNKEFTHIELRVRKVGVAIQDMKVTFANGDSWSPTMFGLIPASGEKDFKLPGGPRKVRSVLIRARCVGFDTFSRVRVYGAPTSKIHRQRGGK